MTDEKRAVIPHNVMGRILDFPTKNSDEFSGTDNSGGGDSMSEVNWQDRYMQTLERDVTEIKKDLREIRNELKVEMAELKKDIKDLVGQHIAEVRHLDQESRKEQLHLDEQRRKEVQEMRVNLDNTTKWIIGMAITTIVGIAAMVVTIILTRISGS